MGIPQTGRGYGAKTGNLKRLVVATRENATRLPDVEVEVAAVEAALGDAEEAIRRQEFHGAEKKRATADLRAALARGKDAGAQLQGAAKFKLGPRSEKLQEFQIPPLRRPGSPRPARAKKQQKEA